ncbi:acyl-CoA-binding domain-containing protein 6 [Drosophila miranda]|uniref:acyl-CoA-binding domain-containing protein 6 n=1 Tax=Drosophila miranda TaxID=7229 RepID=UPI0007E6FA28|nr:acyl-CoA-binding domain-containing protein 6 [Drosophila miranda]
MDLDSDSDLFDLTNDEDDEEGELQAQASAFELATSYVSRQTQTFKDSDLLEFYAYYKQATESGCNQPCPSILQMKARSKWNAWKALGDMSEADAQRSYIEKLQEINPKWKEECSSSKKSKAGGNSWAVHSIESVPVEEVMPDNKKTMFDLVKEKNLSALRQKMQKGDINVKDEHGMALIHWATDRNAVDIIDYLVVSMGVSVDQLDAEMQTPLHYAASCGHVEAVRTLLQLKASLELYDEDGHCCFDVADTEEIFNMLKVEEELRQAAT